MLVTVGIDQYGYKCKPDGTQMNQIKTNARMNTKPYQLEDVADAVGNKGHAMLPGILVGGNKAENCIGMQIFALDFDDGISSEEILKRAKKLGIQVSFAYHTLSSTAENERFRVVFIHPTIIEDIFVVKVMIKMLHKIFPETDKVCKDLNRLFLGGKELFYFDKNARLELVQLPTALYVTIDNQDHFVRNLRSFAESENIVLFNNALAIGLKKDLGTIFGGKLDSAIIHIIEGSGNTPFFIAERSKSNGTGISVLHQLQTCHDFKKKITLETDNYDCRLMEDFESGKDLEHESKFGLMTNYIHISGGIKRFISVIEKYQGTENKEDWKRQIYYAKDYYPQHCDNGMCPYIDICEHLNTIVDTLAMERKVKRLHEEEYVSLERVSEVITNNLCTAIEHVGSAIHLIRAQTGAGKTHNYIEAINKYKNLKFMVIVPTNKLKNQVYNDITKKECKDSVFITMSIPDDSFIPDGIKDRISSAHEAGFHNKPKKILKEFLEEVEKNNPEKLALIEDIKKQIEGLDAYKGERIVVSTHAMFLQMPEKFISEFCVICDEDILQQQVFSKNMEISCDSLQKLQDGDLGYHSDLACKMLNGNLNVYYRINPVLNIPSLSEEQLEEIEVPYEENVNDIVKAGVYVKVEDDEGEEKVIYFCPMIFHKIKMIIMSATLDFDLYRRYFGAVLPVKSYEEAKAKLKGQIKQYTFHSLGKRDLLNKKDALSFLYRISGDNKLPIISFKNIENYLGRTEPLNQYGLNFGNTMGINALKGFNIGILGTFFKREEMYKLVACYLGGNVNSVEDMKPRPRRVEYNNYSFILTSYADPILRLVQLNSIYSEMEQCVGRARALRYDCTVYILSAFPCDQADISTKNYLLTIEGR